MGKPNSQDLREPAMAAGDSGIVAYAAAPSLRTGVP